MKKLLAASLSLSLLALPLIALAQEYPDPVETICNILNIVKIIILAIGLGIAIIVLIIGGITYMTAGGDAEKADKGKKLIINAIIGIVIVLAAAFILGLVQGLLVSSGVEIFSNPCPS